MSLRILGCVVLGATAVTYAQSEQLYEVLPRDAIPSIDRPSFDPVDKARAFSDNELMIGVVGDREQRAYSTWQLDQHEIVNDTVENRPIAVTW